MDGKPVELKQDDGYDARIARMRADIACLESEFLPRIEMLRKEIARLEAKKAKSSGKPNP